MMNYGDNAQMQVPGRMTGSLAQASQPQLSRTFDGISGALDRVRHYNGQVQRILQRTAPSETLSKNALGDCVNTSIAARASYASSLEQLQDALGILGRSLDELEGHI